MEKRHRIINIGRQFGSGGKGVAEALGRKLGIPVYDSELITKAAEESGISPEFFMGSDEKRRFWILGNNDSGLNDTKLFNIQSQTIRAIAQQGDAIFVGRASDYVLRDMECLDVFICAPMETRRSLISEKEGKTPEEAESYIFKKDKARAQYYNFFTFGHWGKASNYDICIDSSLLGIEGTADLIIEFGEKAGLL